MTKETIVIDPVLENSKETSPVVEIIDIMRPFPKPIPVPGPIGLIAW